MKTKFVFAVVLSFLLQACASTSTQMSGVWQAPDMLGQSYNKILVLGVSDAEVNRNMFETAMVEALNSDGAEAVASYTLLPNSGELTEEAVTAIVQQNQYDAVLVTTLVNVDEQTHHVSGQTYVIPNNYITGYPAGYFNSGYNGFYRPGYYGYYRNSYSVVNTPDRSYQTNTAVLETNVYDVATGKLVWSGRSSTINPQSAAVAIPSIVAAVSDELDTDGVIR